MVGHQIGDIPIRAFTLFTQQKEEIQIARVRLANQGIVLEEW
jgi:hypothetical protein